MEALPLTNLSNEISLIDLSKEKEDDKNGTKDWDEVIE